MAGERILIVDDNPVNLRLIQVVLEKQCFVIETARDGIEALSAVQSFRPQLVLTDIQLPQMDGFELATRLKSDARNRDLVVVALTAYAMKGDEEKALRAGCDGFLTKPIENRSLPGLLRQYLDKKDCTVAARNTRDTATEGLDGVMSFEEFKARTGGDMFLMNELIDLFAEDSVRLLELTRKAVDENDIRTLRSTAHALKGCVANFSAPRAYAAAYKLETIDENYSQVEAEAAWKLLNDEIYSLSQALSKISEAPADV